MTTDRHRALDTPPPELLRSLGPGFSVQGIPADAPPVDAAMLRSRLISAADHFSRRHPTERLTLTVSDRPLPPQAPPPAAAPGSATAPGGRPLDADGMSVEERAACFTAVEPRYGFDFLVLPEEVMDRLLLAVETVTLRPLLFDTWNLRSIEPCPGSAVNLHGDPGTGKTLAAHAVAQRLGQRIIHTKFSQLESKYYGEGPKNLDALFHAARAQNAVLFVDEADSLMSQRFETTSQGSEHAANAMRSELVMSLDAHEGLVIFATNLVRSYDRAFDSRVRHIRFPLPDLAARTAIWQRHLPRELPLADDVVVAELATVEGLCGREIRQAVIDAATATAREGRDRVRQADLLTATEWIRKSRIRGVASEGPSAAEPARAEPAGDGVVGSPAPADSATAARVALALESPGPDRE
jgi:hypothetical protein